MKTTTMKIVTLVTPLTFVFVRINVTLVLKDINHRFLGSDVSITLSRFTAMKNIISIAYICEP